MKFLFRFCPNKANAWKGYIYKYHPVYVILVLSSENDNVCLSKIFICHCKVNTR